MNDFPKVWHQLQDAGEFSRATAFPEDWQSYSKKLRSSMWELLGVSYDPELPLDVQVVNSFVHENITLRNVIYQTRPGVYATATIYLPQEKGVFPGVINMHGHWMQGRLAGRVQSRGFSLAKKGYVVISPDTFGLGERCPEHPVFEHHGRVLGSNLFNCGETLMGCILVDNMRTVDLLASLDEVDENRIGATGASGGGNQTMYLAAMDERIKAAVPVCSVGSFDSYLVEPNCCCETLPGGLKLTEKAGILALAAPRAMLICNGLYDRKAFSAQEMLRSYDAALPIYKKLGAWEKFTYRIFNQGHAYSPEVRQAMLGFFELHLKGKGHGMPIEEEPFTVLDEAELMAFAPGKRPDKVMPITTYMVQKSREALERFNAETAFDADGKMEELARVLNFDRKLKVENAAALGEEYGWQRWQFTLSGDAPLPVIMKPGTKDVVIFTHFSGKQELPMADVNAAIASGNTVALLDLSDQGEFAAVPECPTVYHNSSRRHMWLGGTITGRWGAELRAAAEYLAGEFPDKKIVLHGYRETAVASLYSSVFSDKIAQVILEDAPVSYAFIKPSTFYSMALAVPGILKWGDLPLAAALSDSKLQWINPRYQDGSPADVPTAKIECIKQRLV